MRSGVHWCRGRVGRRPPARRKPTRVTSSATPLSKAGEAAPSRSRQPPGSIMDTMFSLRRTPAGLQTIGRLGTVALWVVAWTVLVSQTRPPPGPPPPRACATKVLSPYSGQVVNDAGVAVANATVTVRPTTNPSGLASLFDDAAGQVSRANPVQTDSQARSAFFTQSG